MTPGPPGVGVGASGFEAYSVEHLAAALACAVVIGGWVAVGRRARATLGLEFATRCFGAGAMLMGQALMQAYWLQPARFDHGSAWPLHACDLGAWLAPVALLVSARWLRLVIVFWGFGFATQAFIQPTLAHGPGDLQFFFYWINHATIIAAAVYDVAVRGLRVSYGDLWRVIGITAAWTGVVFVLDAVIGWNYMFLGATDEQPAIVAALGPWPWRVLAIAGVGIAVFHAVWVGLVMAGAGSMARSGRPREAQA